MIQQKKRFISDIYDVDVEDVEMITKTIYNVNGRYIIVHHRDDDEEPIVDQNIKEIVEKGDFTVYLF